MNLLLAFILLGWSVEVLNDYELIIINSSSHSIICYIFYDDGDFKKRYVQAESESRPFEREGLESVECF